MGKTCLDQEIVIWFEAVLLLVEHLLLRGEILRIHAEFPDRCCEDICVGFLVFCGKPSCTCPYKYVEDVSVQLMGTIAQTEWCLSGHEVSCNLHQRFGGVYLLGDSD